jgi:hypothetical protein
VVETLRREEREEEKGFVVQCGDDVSLPCAPGLARTVFEDVLAETGGEVNDKTVRSREGITFCGEVAQVVCGIITWHNGWRWAGACERGGMKWEVDPEGTYVTDGGWKGRGRLEAMWEGVKEGMRMLLKERGTDGGRGLLPIPLGGGRLVSRTRREEQSGGVGRDLVEFVRWFCRVRSKEVAVCKRLEPHVLLEALGPQTRRERDALVRWRLVRGWMSLGSADAREIYQMRTGAVRKFEARMDGQVADSRLWDEETLGRVLGRAVDRVCNVMRRGRKSFTKTFGKEEVAGVWKETVAGLKKEAERGAGRSFWPELSTALQRTISMIGGMSCAVGSYEATGQKGRDEVLEEMRLLAKGRFQGYGAHELMRLLRSALASELTIAGVEVIAPKEARARLRALEDPVTRKVSAESLAAMRVVVLGEGTREQKHEKRVMRREERDELMLSLVDHRWQYDILCVLLGGDGRVPAPPRGNGRVPRLHFLCSTVVHREATRLKEALDEAKRRVMEVRKLKGEEVAIRRRRPCLSKELAKFWEAVGRKEGALMEGPSSKSKWSWLAGQNADSEEIDRKMAAALFSREGELAALVERERVFYRAGSGRGLEEARSRGLIKVGGGARLRRGEMKVDGRICVVEWEALEGEGESGVR